MNVINTGAREWKIGKEGPRKERIKRSGEYYEGKEKIKRLGKKVRI